MNMKYMAIGLGVLLLAFGAWYLLSPSRAQAQLTGNDGGPTGGKTGGKTTMTAGTAKAAYNETVEQK